MKKLFSFAVAALCVTTMFAKQYCQEALTAGTNTIYLTCEKLSEGNYQFIVEGENLVGFGGSFIWYTEGGERKGKNIKDLTPSEKTSTKIVVPVVSEADPEIYTPFYVMMPGEVNFGYVNDAEWGSCVKADVTGVSLDKTTAELPLNKTLNLKATVAPSNAGNKNVTWTSSEPTVATVADGVVTPVAKGTTTITVTTEEGSFTATCAVTVIDATADKPTAAPTVPTYPANQVKAIYSETYNAVCNFQDWGGGTQYTQDTYGKKFVTFDRGYLGLTFAELNCATMETLHADVWVADDCSMRFVPILHLPDNTANYPEWGVTVNLEGGKWNSIEIALNEGDWANHKDWMKVYQLKIDNVPNRTFWVNNIYFFTSLDEDTEKPVMGTATLVEGSATQTSVVLNVTATDNRGVVLYLLKNGEDEIGKFSPTDGKITVNNLPAGTTLTLSVYAIDGADNVSDNAATVSVTTLAFPEFAAAPDFTNKEVLAIYADGIELAVAHDFKLDNFGGAPYTLVSENGQNYIFYNMKSHNGTSWGDNNDGANAIVGKDAYKGTKGGVNVSAMDYLHVDIWTDAACPSFELFVNDTKLGGQELSAGWNSMNFPLSAYPVAPELNWGLDNVNWMKFVGFNDPKSVAIDNVYFWKNKGGETAIDAAEVALVVRKTIENGQVVIIRDGVRYNVMGNVIR